MEEDNNQKMNDEEYITINVPRHGKRSENHTGGRRSRIDNNEKGTKKSKIVIVRRVILILIVIILAIIAFLGAKFAIALYKSDGSITQALLSVTSDIMGTDDPIFVLLLGVSEDIDTELTDTIILCGYNPKSQKAFMLSIPRDTFVGDNPSYASGFDKINALYRSDVKRTVKAVKSLTGIDCDFYVVVKNTAIPNIVSAVGTVEFDVPIDMNYDDETQNLHIHLKKGLQMIDKDKAEQLLRFRHNNDGSSYSSSYGDNDYGRMKTQRDFIKAVVKNLSTNGSPEILRNAASFIFGNIDTNLSLPRVMSYIPSALEFDVDSLKTEMLSVSSAKLNDLYFFIANTSRNKTICENLIEYLELDEKEAKKVFKTSLFRGQVVVPPQALNVTNGTVSNTYNNIVNNTVNNTVNNIVNNTVNNVVNNTVNNTTNTSITNTVTPTPTPTPSKEAEVPTPTPSKEPEMPTPTPSKEPETPTPTPSKEPEAPSPTPDEQIPVDPPETETE